MGLDITKVYRVTDEATSGKWFDVGDGARLKIAKVGNERHESVLKRLRRPFKNMRTIPEDTQTELSTKALSEAVLLDWEGVDENGEPVECTPDKRYRYLMDFPDFRELVVGIALNVHNFTDEETDEKN